MFERRNTTSHNDVEPMLKFDVKRKKEKKKKRKNEKVTRYFDAHLPGYRM
jgi:hypothetical protein